MTTSTKEARESCTHSRRECAPGNMNQLRPIKATIIMACRNAAETIGTQLDALAAQDCDDPWELIVSDSGSTDETLSIVNRYIGIISNLRVIDSSDRQGKAHALNRAAKTARGEYLLYCDPEDEVAPGWLSAMCGALTQTDFVTSGIDIEKLNPRRVIRWQHNPDLILGPFPGGSTLGVRRWIHDAIGGFDESMMRLADRDYCLRIQLKGIELREVPEATIYIRCGNGYAKLYGLAFGCGEYGAKILKKFRNAAVPGASARQGLPFPSFQLPESRGVKNRNDLASLMWHIGYQAGRLKGRLKSIIHPH